MMPFLPPVQQETPLPTVYNLDDCPKGVRSGARRPCPRQGPLGLALIAQVRG